MSIKHKPGSQIGYEVDDKSPLPYLLFLPSDYGDDPDKKWPLIMSLHGAGERGDDLDILREYGPAKEAEKNPEFPFVCLSPQCPDDALWPGLIGELKDLLDNVKSSYSVDEDRIYLTGFSLGGFGTWAMASIYPEMFAAIVPICGGGMADQAENLKDMPIWAFHGAEDDAVPVQVSQAMAEAVNGAGGDAKLTIYPGVGHDSWTQTYENPTLYTWLLEHRRPD